MGYFSLHAYDADVWLPEFRGLNQADIELNPDIRFAAEAENVETPLGVLQPMAPSVPMVHHHEFDTDRVETLAVLHRRWYSGQGDKRWYTAAAGGKLYQKQANSNNEWDEIPFPTGVLSYGSDVWSWVTYEKTVNGVTVDVLLMSNATDGMIMIIPPDRPRTWGNIKANNTWGNLKSGTWADVRSPAWVVEVIDTRTDREDPDEPQKKFAVIERYGERIWGCGVPGEPDTLYYSKAYLPDDWTADSDIPENSAGDVMQPSWDGDQFFALKRFGDQLLAFKENKIWRVMGLSPGEFMFHEQYGKGTQYVNTIAVDGERVFMVGDEGVLVYDGMNTTPYAKEQVREIWKTVNRSALAQVYAVMLDRRYYVSFPTGDSTVNNAMLIFDLNEGTILFYPDMSIEAFMPADEILFATTSSLPGQILMLQKDSWSVGAASGAACKWVTPWMDFGYKRIQKGGFDLYFIPEVQEEEVTFTISIQTEKKKKTKQYVCQPLSEAQKAIDREHRMKRLHFGGSGRKFRIIIETAEGVTAPWRLIGGLQLVVETDPD